MLEPPNLALGFAAGMLSFLSPCCLPLVPGYLAAISSGQAAEDARLARRRALGRSSLFVGTFSLVFVLLGLSATAIGALMVDHRETLNTVAGVAIIALGALLVASLFIATLNREWRPTALIERAGSGGPVVAGAAFAIAWTPCVGPTLGAILGLASISSSTAQGGLLLLAYSAGLGVPFMATAFAADSATRSFAFVRRHYLALNMVSGVVLIGMGVLVLTGELFRLNIEAQQVLSKLGLDLLYNI